MGRVPRSGSAALTGVTLPADLRPAIGAPFDGSTEIYIGRRRR
jgi:hypothetical protein